MQHRFIDIFQRELGPDIPVLGVDFSPVSTHSIWQIGNNATPIRMAHTAVTRVSPTKHLGDPQREPVTGDWVVYSEYNIVATLYRAINIASWTGSTKTQLYTEGGTITVTGSSLEPSWKPDGSKILFRSKGSGSELNLIKHMNPDGTGVTTLYTGGGAVVAPCYSYDGTKIAWAEYSSPGGFPQQCLLRVANADGSSPVTVRNNSTGLVGEPAWQHAHLVIGFREQGLSFTSNELWRKVNHDGTGLTTWLTISRASSYGPGDADPDAIMYSWLENDTEIATTVRELAHADPDARLTLIDSTGNHYISPAQYMPVNTGSPDTRPVAIRGRAEGVERIYFIGSFTNTGVVSVLPDGSDFRTDWDGTGTSGGSSFHGFRGDTLSV